MLRKTRSNKNTAQNAEKEIEVKAEVKVPGKRGRKKKSEIQNVIAESNEQTALVTQNVRRSTRGKSLNASNSSLTDSSVINDSVEPSNVDESLVKEEEIETIKLEPEHLPEAENLIKTEEEVAQEGNNEPQVSNITVKEASVTEDNSSSLVTDLEHKLSSVALVEQAPIEEPVSVDVEMQENKNESEPNNLMDIDTSDLKQEPIDVSVKSTELIDIDEMDGSYLRRSRRLKSIYIETPAPIKTDEQGALIKETPTSSAAAAPPFIEEKFSGELKDVIISDVKNEPNINDEQIISQEMDADKKQSDLDLDFVDIQCDPRLSHFVTIRDNIYIKSSDKVICKVNKTMKCDCTITEEDIKSGEMGCRYNCINRLLFIECSAKCRCGEFCDNQQFQRYQYSPISVFKTEKKGFGIRAVEDIPPETFIIEYVGEVLNNKQFEKRAKKYSKDKNRHYYFMALRSNAIIDATVKGNISRFINHSCDPNAATQKWTINGELRVGFFSIRYIKRGEEITFDYQFQRYGKEAQKCYCESEKCRGWIGEKPLDDEPEDVKLKKEKGKKVLGRKPKIKVEKTDVPGEEEEEEETKEESDDNDQENDENLAQDNEKLAAKKSADEGLSKKLKKRQEMYDDLEVKDEINRLTKSGLKNRADTIRLSRLVVRAKNTEARSQIIKILIAGDLPCLRLFLDYNGLRLLHSWMCDINVKNSLPDLYLCLEVMNAFELLPITNKTVLRDSKVLERVEKWKNLDLEKKKLTKEEKKQAKADKKKNKGNKLLADESLKSNEEVATTLVRTFDVLEELPMIKLIVKEKASELLSKWEILKEDFRIPKKQKQEIMIEHEREAGMDEWQENIARDSLNNDRLKHRFGEDSNTTGISRNFSTPYRRACDPIERQQRRQLFEMKMAQIDMEKKMMIEHENNCAIFGLPSSTLPLNIPVRVNRLTGEYHNAMGAIVPPPPNHHNFKYEPLAYPTDPNEYILPPMDLPEHWKFAITPYGQIYYYHEKIRQPQWEAPIKFLPLNTNDSDDYPESDESDTSTEDSEEEELRELLEMLKRKKQLASPQTTTNQMTLETSAAVADEDDLEKKIMNNMISNPPEQAIKLSQLTEQKRFKKKSRSGLGKIQFIRPRTEEDKLYGRAESKRYKEVKEKLRRDKKRKMLLGEKSNVSDEEEDDENESDERGLSRSIVDELEIYNKSKQLDKLRKIKKDVDVAKLKKKPVVLSPTEHANIKRQFRDEIKEEITKFLLPYREESCTNGRILSEDDYMSLVNKLTFSVLTKESKHCAQSSSILKATDSVKGKTKEYIKKYMSKFEGPYQRKADEQDYEIILNRF